MKSTMCLATLVVLAAVLPRQSPVAAPETKPMQSTVIDWQTLVPTPTRNGQRRDVLDGRTATLDRLHAHITTLNPGENTGPLHRHPQEEVVIIKEGTVEVNIDGRQQVVGAGSVIFFGVNENENMTNVGTTAAVYTVLQWFTPLTPKS
jgi:XRE family transcriptional regulator, regulator of sulfur utilization